jgi:hypothetical protein
MAVLFHWHSPIGTITGNCLKNTHHPNCTWPKFGLTPQNEVRCKQPGGGPAGRPCKCEHEVPDDVGKWARRSRSSKRAPRAGKRKR